MADSTIDRVFIAEGILTLGCQEGSFAGDSWELDDTALDDTVADYFGIERAQYTGNRYVGRVRITIERLGD